MCEMKNVLKDIAMITPRHGNEKNGFWIFYNKYILLL